MEDSSIELVMLNTHHCSNSASGAVKLVKILVEHIKIDHNGKVHISKLNHYQTKFKITVKFSMPHIYELYLN